MAKSKTIRVSEEELLALQAFRDARGEGTTIETAVQERDNSVSLEAQKALADAFVQAIERTRPKEKKTVATRVPKTPWTPPEGEARVKFKRKMYHHGIPLLEKVTNEDIELLNRIKPGIYCDGWVRANLRKDRGIDITYPVRTAAQRLKLVNTYGVRSFTELLKRLVDEKANPSRYKKPEDADLYDYE